VTLLETDSLKDRMVFEQLHAQLNRLGSKRNLFIQSLELQHLSVLEETAAFHTGARNS